VEFFILGPLEFRSAAGQIELGSRKQRLLLAALLLRANEVVPAARLLELLWPDAPPADAAKALQVHVSRLRRALGDGGVLETRRGGYLLRVDQQSFDLPRFEERLAKARSLLAGGEMPAARQAFGEALELWRGAPLAEFAAEPIVQPAVGRLEELYLAAVEGRIEADLALGDHAALVGELEGLVMQHPFREHLRGQLMLTLYRCGRQAEALQAYRAARRALVDELGIEPGKPLQELEQAILRQDPAIDLPRGAGSAPTRPGRRAAGVFVGRDREVAELSSALEDAAVGRGRLYLASGETGVGKTRLADELASRAKDRGARVLWGRCWKGGGAPPYWPWTQALRTLGDEAPPLEPEAEENERFRAFVDVASALRRAGAEQPLFIVFDDLHRADEPSLLLLEFIAGELAEMHLAIVGTYLEGADLPPTLEAFADHAAHHILRLRPLEVEDVALFLELAGGAPGDAPAVHAETGGNPRLIWQRIR
jgi:DNA-binding SARP family transcriptional activator